MPILHNISREGEVILFNPFEDNNAIRDIVKDLQGNILKGHDRNEAILFFLRFNRDKMRQVKAKISEFSRYVTSFHLQMQEWLLFHGTTGLEKTLQRTIGRRKEQLPKSELKRTVAAMQHLDRPMVPGGTFVNFFLTSKGYEALGKNKEELRRMKFDERFIDGINSSLNELNDPDPNRYWDDKYWDRENNRVKDIDALLLVADDDASNLGQKVRMFLRDVLEVQSGNELVKVVAVEHAKQQRDKYEQPIEHFGYRDGISNPLFLITDTEKILDYGGYTKWDPRAPLDLVLVTDPYGCHGENSLGSYLVYRKYEQHVGKFEILVRNLAKDLGFESDSEEELEKARALIVGRFRDGTPLAVRNQPYSQRYRNENYNAFSFEEDPDGLKCPLHAHIRKINPRLKSEDEKAKGFAVWKPTLKDEKAEKLALIVRRGITYGKRKSDYDHSAAYQVPDLPDSGVGLLFMCFQMSIKKQFEFIHKQFANRSNFSEDGTGLDSIIGQEPGVQCPVCNGSGKYEERVCIRCGGGGKIPRPAPMPTKWPLEWGKSPCTFSNAMSNSITLKGGEYFFAPSISFLASLAGDKVKNDKAAGKNDVRTVQGNKTNRGTAK